MIHVENKRVTFLSLGLEHYSYPRVCLNSALTVLVWFTSTISSAETLLNNVNNDNELGIFYTPESTLQATSFKHVPC